jgi:hypothetical protein
MAGVGEGFLIIDHSEGMPQSPESVRIDVVSCDGVCELECADLCMGTPSYQHQIWKPLYCVQFYGRIEEPARKAAFYTVVLLVATHKRPRNILKGGNLSYIKGSPSETPMALLHPTRSQMFPLQSHTSA